MTSHRLSELRASDILDHLTADSIFVLPVGAIEQHGPHLPFNTDLVVAEYCATTVVDQVGEELDLWLLESLAYTKSNEHAGTPGTVWLGPETLLRLLDDIGRSLAATPARKLAFVNGHGGNSALLNVACRELHLHHGLETFLLHPSVPPDQGGAPPKASLAWASMAVRTRPRS
ncbi:MAG: creatininase family protein [Acidimicrobiales bacterium]